MRVRNLLPNADLLSRALGVCLALLAAHRQVLDDLLQLVTRSASLRDLEVQDFQTVLSPAKA